MIPCKNAARFADDAKEKRRLGFVRRCRVDDEALLQALRAGLPPSGGIALGNREIVHGVDGSKDDTRNAGVSTLAFVDIQQRRSDAVVDFFFELFAHFEER